MPEASSAAAAVVATVKGAAQVIVKAVKIIEAIRALGVKMDGSETQVIMRRQKADD